MEVCELWGGKGLVRALGSLPIIELYYLQRDPENTSNFDSVHADAIPLMARDEGMEIWDFESAIYEGLPKGGSLGSDNSVSPESLLGYQAMPNIGLNLSQRVPRLEFILVAAAGIVLQAGVMVFAGVEVYLPPWDQRFEKGSKPVQKHPFPSLASGTVVLVIGMFLCCYIVDRSTTGSTWAITEPDGYRVRAAWIQKGGEVNDQHFKSYIQRSPNPKSSQLSNAVRKFIKILPNSAADLTMRRSHKASKSDQGYLMMVAVAVRLAGFVLQFVRLRALSWHVTIAQLVASGVMMGLRAVLRRGLIDGPEWEELEMNGYELDTKVIKISGCNHWM